jgi:4-hydroxybenzoate polyprenyltransferase
MALFRLVRLPNLFIVALTQYLLYYRVIRPAITNVELMPRFDHLHFSLLVLVTVLITACGNVINDVVDYPIDQINRPESVIVHRKISFQTAYWLIAATAMSGFFLSLYLSFYIRQVPFLLLYPVALGGLYLYTIFFKRLLIAGNLLIGLYCAGAGAVLWLAEQPALKQLALKNPSFSFHTRTIFLWFLGFAFLATLFREIVKDIEDLKGDQEGGYRTMPVRLGFLQTKKIALGTGLLLMLFIGYYGWTYQQQFSATVLWYMLLAVGIPLLGTIVFLFRAESSKQFHQASQLVKFIILTGILSLFFIKP